jgi:hypothetical protein
VLINKKNYDRIKKKKQRLLCKNTNPQKTQARKNSPKGVPSAHVTLARNYRQRRRLWITDGRIIINRIIRTATSFTSR